MRKEGGGAMSVKLVILGLLMGGEKHPYEMQHIVKMRKVDKFISLYKGSIYYAVEQLKEEGLIEVAEVIREEKYPDKKVYRITERGKDAFYQLMEEQFAKQEQFYDPLYTALIFAKYCDPTKIIGLLEQKICYMEKKIEVLESSFSESKTTIPPTAQYIYTGLIAHAKTDLEWLRRVSEDVKENRWKNEE